MKFTEHALIETDGTRLPHFLKHVIKPNEKVFYLETCLSDVFLEKYLLVGFDRYRAYFVKERKGNG